MADLISINHLHHSSANLPSSRVIALPKEIHFQSSNIIGSYLEFLDLYQFQIPNHLRGDYSTLESIVINILFDTGYSDSHSGLSYQRYRPVMLIIGSSDTLDYSTVTPLTKEIAKRCIIPVNDLFRGQQTNTISEMMTYLSNMINVPEDIIATLLFDTKPKIVLTPWSSLTERDISGLTPQPKLNWKDALIQGYTLTPGQIADYPGSDEQVDFLIKYPILLDLTVHPPEDIPHLLIAPLLPEKDGFHLAYLINVGQVFTSSPPIEEPISVAIIPFDVYFDRYLIGEFDKFILDMEHYSDEEIAKYILFPSAITRSEVLVNLYSIIGIDTFHLVPQINPKWATNRFTTLFETDDELDPPYIIHGRLTNYRYYSLDELNNRFQTDLVLPERPTTHFSMDEIKRLYDLIDDNMLKCQIVKWMSLSYLQRFDIPANPDPNLLLLAYYAGKYYINRQKSKSEIARKMFNSMDTTLIKDLPLFIRVGIIYQRLNVKITFVEALSYPIEDNYLAERILQTANYYLLILTPQPIENKDRWNSFIFPPF